MEALVDERSRLPMSAPSDRYILSGLMMDFGGPLCYLAASMSRNATDELRNFWLLGLYCDRVDDGMSEIQLNCLLSTFKPLRMIGTVKQLSPRGPEGITGQLHSLLAAVAL